MFLINGQNTEELGVSFIKGTGDELNKETQFKNRFEYDWKDENGVEYDKTEVLKKQPVSYVLPLIFIDGSKYPAFKDLMEDNASEGFSFQHDDEAWHLYYNSLSNYRKYPNGSITVTLNVTNNWETPKITTNAPTAITFDELARTINFTYNPDFTTVGDYEYTLNGGVTWTTLTAKPFNVGTESYTANTIGVRVKETSETYASPTLYYGQIIKGYVSAPTAFVWNRGARTLDFTYTAGFASPSDYEVSRDGVSWETLPVKPFPVENEYFPSGTFRIRVKETSMNYASVPLVHNAVIKEEIEAPTDVVFDEDLRRLDFTYNPDFTAIGDYEVTKDAGVGFMTLAVKPYQVDQNGYPADTVGFRVKETATAYESAITYYDQAIASDLIMTNFIAALTSDGTYTFDDDLLLDSWSGLPIKPNSGTVLLPYAYKASNVAMVNVAGDGSIANATFSRAGSGWSMYGGDIVERAANVARVDEFYYSNDLGYLIEGSGTTVNTQSVALNAQLGSVITPGSGFSLTTPATFRDNTANGTHGVLNPPVNVSDNNIDFRTSVFVKKANTSRYIMIRSGSFAFMPWSIAFFDWETNTLVGKSNEVKTTKIVDVGNGWKYIEMVAPSTANGSSKNAQMLVGLTDSISGGYTGDGTNTFQFTNLNIVRNSQPQSFIYANGSTVTRPAESLSIAITALTDVWMKTDAGERLIENVPVGSFNMHSHVTNGKLISAMIPMRKFTSTELSKFDI